MTTRTSIGATPAKPMRAAPRSDGPLRRFQLLLGSAVLASVNAWPQALQPASFLPIAASVVRVEVQRVGGGLGIGSGVTVAPEVIVTNCHVTRDAGVIRISGAGQLWEVAGEYADGAHDVCFLQVPGWSGRPVGFAERDTLRVGAPVAAIGFTGGTGRSLQFGAVRALHPLDGARIIETDAAFTSGASGGGLFDAQGALVGLLTFRSREVPGAFYALPAGWIREHLPKDRQWSDVRPLYDAAAFWQRDSVTQPYFMRAASLSAERRWGELIDLTDAWAKADPNDAEPFRLRGKAFQATDHGQAAVYAFIEALRLDPEDPQGWYGLALAYASIGDLASARQAQSRLAGLDDALAARLRDEIEHLRARP